MEEIRFGKWKVCVRMACQPKSSGWDTSQNGRGVGLVGWRAGKWHGPARGGVRGQHDKVATPTSAMPPSAAQLVRLDGIGPPPVTYMKKRSSLKGREVHLSSVGHC